MAARREIEHPGERSSSARFLAGAAHVGQWFAIEISKPYSYGAQPDGNFTFEFAEIIITNRTTSDAVLNVAHRLRVGDSSYYTKPEFRVRAPAKDFVAVTLKFHMHNLGLQKAGGVRDGKQYLRLRDIISGHEEKHWI